MAEFQIIQGGMGIGVSNWRLARAVALRGQLGVVSGTGLAAILARQLQNGDPAGDMRRALAAFPNQRIAEDILRQYFQPGRASRSTPYRLSPMSVVQSSRGLQELIVAANFVEVYLAKEGHAGKVGINLLEKIQMPTLASLFGAMLAGVDYVLMGAGIPRAIPGVLDAFAAGRAAEYRIDVADVPPGEVFVSRLDPAEFISPPPSSLPLTRPKFFAIVSSATLAMTLARKSNGRVDGFIVELPTAGGHNAPPRGQTMLNSRGEPIYGPRDEPDLGKIREIGLPFYLAGGYASPSGLAEARSHGASGIQVGTLFAFAEESGIDSALKGKAIAQAIAGTADVFTDPRTSPTGFPFKVLQLAGTLSEAAVYDERPRICDIGYLRQAYRKADGTLGYRCSAEPVEDYVKKGGELADTQGRKCLCNGLLGNLGLGQVSGNGYVELPLLTSGDDIANLPKVLRHTAGGRPLSDTYTAADVLGYLSGTDIN
ncbi:MAG: nitronate monooxygenase [Phycisphaerales bacterium]|nr:nitronate monooxygenase [Phycisphaerales bacterium]